MSFKIQLELRYCCQLILKKVKMGAGNLGQEETAAQIPQRLREAGEDEGYRHDRCPSLRIEIRLPTTSDAQEQEQGRVRPDASTRVVGGDCKAPESVF